MTSEVIEEVFWMTDETFQQEESASLLANLSCLKGYLQNPRYQVVKLDF